MKGMNYHHANVVGKAFTHASLASTTGNGEAIVEPWKQGNQLAFHVTAGAIGAGSATVVVQGRRRDDGTTWETLQNVDGNNAAFLATCFVPGGPGDDGTVLGTLPLSDVDGMVYEAVRLSITTTGVTTTFNATYAIAEIRSHPSGQEDQLFSVMFKKAGE